ncbi:hypothetical protein GGR53DRAFT_528704 [Hypoxylon sp. FL1150]|nr:hypothetical protein GGR53DRAFT_528704 [Hypoxylon sp. FL1150]
MMASFYVAPGEKLVSSESTHADHKQEYNIRQLSTQSVTLFPSRAQVVREIKDVPLKTGINQIVFVGLTASLDEHSIKIEGVGAATISDTVVESLPNRETFQDVYPDTDSDSTDTSSDDGKEEDMMTTPVAEKLRAVRDEINLIRIEQADATELIESAKIRLTILNSYAEAQAQTPEVVVDIEKLIATYKAERERMLEDDRIGKDKIRQLRDKIAKLAKDEARLSALVQKETAKADKAKAKAAKAKGKEKEDQQRKKRDQTKEKARIRKERESFWPKNVYSVRVNIEVRGPSPVSSRRSSMSSQADVGETSSKDPVGATSGDLQTLTCDLTLSYVTDSAYWSPTYDLALSTTANTGSLCFDALLTNKTSETWNNCKIILSTSQTNFSSLNEDVPSLTPWRVGLASGGSLNHGDIVYSNEEKARKHNFSARNSNVINQSRRQGVSGRPKGMPTDVFIAAMDPMALRSSHGAGIPSSDMGREAMTLSQAQPSLMTFQESSFEESGLSVTYDLPGLKCLPPSSTVSKQRVARVTFIEVDFSYTVVAKHNPAAYLQAKLRNIGELTLLRGPVGLTLDGGFLGRSSLPRCAPGSSFKLNLGVDPAIQVAYHKPEVQHGQLGMFSKDNSTVYTRTLLINNLRSGPKSKAVQLTALDQVPLSEDESLHIVILLPKGLAVGGPDTPSNGEVEVASENDVTWGKAMAKMKDGGQIAWDVTVNAGCTAKLILQYQCVYPTGESMTNV